MIHLFLFLLLLLLLSDYLNSFVPLFFAPNTHTLEVETFFLTRLQQRLLTAFRRLPTHHHHHISIWSSIAAAKLKVFTNTHAHTLKKCVLTHFKRLHFYWLEERMNWVQIHLLVNWDKLDFMLIFPSLFSLQKPWSLFDGDRGVFGPWTMQKWTLQSLTFRSISVSLIKKKIGNIIFLRTIKNAGFQRLKKSIIFSVPMPKHDIYWVEK